MLKNKKHNSQKDWLLAWEQAKALAQTEQGKERAERLISTALSRIPTEGKCVYGWSGGKDALALQCICERAGIKECVLGTIGFQWEYPSFVEFVKKNAPAHLTIKDFGVTADYLNEHEEMLFPENSRDAYKWFIKCNQSAYYGFAEEREADHIILGHRKLDGNRVDEGRIKKKVFPMWDFTHEDNFLLLAYSGKSLPMQYYYPRGFHCGTGAWVMREGGEKAMREIYEIDKTILEKHMDIDKIREFMEKVN